MEDIAKESDIRIVNVYGQYSWHDDVRIIGNKQGLLQLLHLISDAIKNGKSSTDDYEHIDIMTSVPSTGGWQCKLCDRIGLCVNLIYIKLLEVGRVL